MSFKKLGSFLLIVLLVGMLAVSGSAGGSVQYNEAFAVAQQHVLDNAWGKLEQWDGSHIGGGVPLYNVEGDLTGWGFNVIKNSEEIGYAIVSTRSEPFQVVEYGAGEGLPFDRIIHIAKAEVSNFHGLSVPANYKFIYSMALSYGVEFRPPGTEPVYWLNRVGTISKEQFPSIRNAAFQGSALALEPIVASSAEEYYLPNVPNYQWYRGCSPTASANQLGYLYYQYGHTNLPLGNTLIDSLANAMGTGANGATPRANIGPGMVSVLSSYGYSGYWSQLEARGVSYSTFGRYKSEILASRTIHCILDSDSDDWYYSTQPGTAQAHSVTGMGYRINTDGAQWIVVHDTWPGPTDVYLLYGSVEMGIPQWVYLGGDLH